MLQLHTFTSEHDQVVETMITLTHLSNLNRAIVAGDGSRELYLALRRRDYAAHRRLARITLPIWLYVAVSGWVIYYLLYVKTY